MIVAKKKLENRPIEIDLTGEQGNAYYLLGLANSLSKQLGYDSKQIKEEMTTSDYENLIQVFDNYFGNYVILYR
jgi:hypothetical protein